MAKYLILNLYFADRLHCRCFLCIYWKYVHWVVASLHSWHALEPRWLTSTSSFLNPLRCWPASPYSRTRPFPASSIWSDSTWLAELLPLKRLPCPGYHVLVVLIQLSCALVWIFILSRLTCQAHLSRLTSPSCLVRTILPWLSCPGYPATLSCRCYAVPAVPSLLSCSGHPLFSLPVQAHLSRLTCLGWPFRLPFQTHLSQLSGTLSCPDFLSRFSCPAVLPRLSIFGCPAPAVLSWLYYDDYPVPVVQFSVILYIAVMFWSLSFLRPV